MKASSLSGMKLSISLGAQCFTIPDFSQVSPVSFFLAFLLRLFFLEIPQEHGWQQSWRKGAGSSWTVSTMCLIPVMLWLMGYRFPQVSFPMLMLLYVSKSLLSFSRPWFPHIYNRIGKETEINCAQIIVCLDTLCVKLSCLFLPLNITDIFCSSWKTLDRDDIVSQLSTLVRSHEITQRWGFLLHPTCLSLLRNYVFPYV